MTKKYFLKSKQLGNIHQPVKPTPSPTLIRPTKTFHHPDFDYSISYPNDWQIYMSETIETDRMWNYDDIILHSPDFKISDNVPVMERGAEIRIKVQDSNKNSVVEAFMDMYPSVSASGVTRLTIDGRLALQFYTNTSRIYTLALFDKKLYIFLLRFSSGNTNYQKKSYSDILAHFRFDSCSNERRSCFASKEQCNKQYSSYLECKNKPLTSNDNFIVYLEGSGNLQIDQDAIEKTGSLYIYDQAKLLEYKIPGQFSFFNYTDLLADAKRKYVVLYGGSYSVVGARAISLESKRQIGQDFKMFGDKKYQYFWKNYFIYLSVKNFTNRLWGGGEAFGISALNLDTGRVTILYSPSELTQYMIQSIKENKLVLTEKFVDKSEDWNEPTLIKENYITLDLNSIL